MPPSSLVVQKMGEGNEEEGKRKSRKRERKGLSEDDVCTQWYSSTVCIGLVLLELRLMSLCSSSPQDMT